MAVVLDDFLERPYRIPFPENDTDLLAFVQATEQDLLRGILGTTLYNAYVAGIGAGSPAQKWVDLRDGSDYTYSGVEYHFKGLDAMLVPGIFALWVKETSDRFTTSGTVRNAPAANTTGASPRRRISEAWGTFLDRVGSECEYRDSLYGFLSANTSDYDFNSAEWTTPRGMNAFDL